MKLIVQIVIGVWLGIVMATLMILTLFVVYMDYVMSILSVSPSGLF